MSCSSASVKWNLFKPVVCRCILSCQPLALRRKSTSRTSVPDPFDSHFLNAITVENIRSSFRPWIIKCVDKCVFKELSFEDRAIVFNRLLMVHCFEVFLQAKYLSSKKSAFDCEIVLPALCSLIDRSIENGAKSFVVGLSQLSQLTTLSKLMETTEERLLLELLKCRNDLVVDDFDDDSNYLIFEEEIVSEFIEPSKFKPYDISLFGPPTPAAAVYPLMMGRAKALQSLEKEAGGEMIWPIFCYPLSNINSEDTFCNIAKLLNDSSYSAGGTIHLIINCGHGGFEEAKDSVDSSSKLIKRLADQVKAPLIHVKADEVDSIVYVMNMVSDFRAKHGRDIFVNLIGGSTPAPHKNVALAGFIKEFLVGGKDPLVALYGKELITNKVLSKVEFDDRKESFLKKLVEHADSSHRRLTKKTVPLEKRIKEPFTGADAEAVHLLVAAMSKNSCMKNYDPSSTSPEFKENPVDCTVFSSFRHGPVLRTFNPSDTKLNWKNSLTLAYATLIQEGWNVHVSRSTRGPTSAHDDPHLLIPKEAGGSGEYELKESTLSPFAMAGFQIGFSSATDNILAIWEVPENLEPSTLHDIMSKYYGVPKINDLLTSKVVFIVPTYFNIPSLNGVDSLVSSQMSQVLKVCEDSDVITGFNDQLRNCNVVVASLSTPANLFHLIRRHAYSATPKPLIIFVPNVCSGSSTVDDVVGDTCFQPFIGDSSIFDSDLKNVILCTGRIQHELKEERSRRNLSKHIAIGHIEQLSPFPYSNLIQDMERFPSAKIWWAQEEEITDGSWNFVQFRLTGLFGEERVVRFTGHYRPTYSDVPSLSERASSIFDIIVDS